MKRIFKKPFFYIKYITSDLICQCFQSKFRRRFGHYYVALYQHGFHLPAVVNFFQQKVDRRPSKHAVILRGITERRSKFTARQRPSQRANGILTVAGGIVITFTKEILTLITG